VSNLNKFQQFLTNIPKNVSEGIRKSAEATRVADENYPSALNISGKYQQELKNQGVSLRETPVQAVAALGARLITDLTNDGTRGVYWRYNHPLAILDKTIDKTLESAVGEKAYKELGKAKTGLMAASVAIPATALAGTYDITNVGEMFRPKGFAQAYAEEGSEDRRETAQPTQELFERFFLGRQGQPLKYATAKQDIPDLTPERYANFMRNYYQDKGLFGIVKATPENLQGVPEIRMLGYPVNIASAATAIGGIVGVSAALRSKKEGRSVVVQPGFAGIADEVKTTSTTPGYAKGLTRRGLAGGAVGALAGALTGTAVNAVIAQANRPKLPTIAEYSSQEMQ
jgi:hypothetical protein